MQSNKYQEMMDQIAVPSSLKAATKEQLCDEIKRQKAQHIYRNISLLAAALVLIVGLSFWWHQQQVGGTTVIQVVALSAADQRAPVRLSAFAPLRKSIAPETYQASIPTMGFDDLSVVSAEITAFYEEPGQDAVAVLGHVLYQTVNDMAISLTFTDQELLLPLPVTIGSSQLAGTPVGVGYDAEQMRFYGVFIKDGYRMLLIAEEMEEAEFVSYLLRFIEY